MALPFLWWGNQDQLHDARGLVACRRPRQIHQGESQLFRQTFRITSKLDFAALLYLLKDLFSTRRGGTPQITSHS